MSSILWFLLLIVFIFLGYIYVLYKDTLTHKRNQRKASLKNKVVVITGASSGIGEAIAHAFYDEGCQVVLAARRLPHLLKVKKELMDNNTSLDAPEPVVLQLDLGCLEECEQFVRRVEEVCGRVDVLVNNGGVTHRGANCDTTLEIHRRIMDVNYLGTVAVTRAILPKMVERRSGHIAIVGSALGRMALPYRGPYCASKHALLGFADSLRAEVGGHNIKVSTLLPGYVKTELSAKAINGVTGEETGILDEAAENGYSPEVVARRLLSMIINEEEEAFLCQPLVRCALLLRRVLPSAYFYLISKRRE